MTPAPSPRPRARGARARATIDDVAVGARLRSARMLAGKTQEELGHALGVSFQAVQKYEIGENRIASGRLLAASKFLGVPVEQLFGFTGAALPALSPHEADVLRYFRRLPSDLLRERLLLLLRTIVREAE